MFYSSPETMGTDESLERLVAMCNQTCLLVLDKALAAISRSSMSYDGSARRLHDIGYSMGRAVREVGSNLPENNRAIRK